MTKHTMLKLIKHDWQLQSDQQNTTWLKSIIATFLGTELGNLTLSTESADVDSIKEDLHPPPTMQRTCSK